MSEKLSVDKCKVGKKVFKNPKVPVTLSTKSLFSEKTNISSLYVEFSPLNSYVKKRLKHLWFDVRDLFQFP